MNAKSLFAGLGLAAILGGCQPNQNSSPAQEASAPTKASASSPVVTAKQISVADFQAAVGKTYIQRDAKSDNEGVTEFYACFREWENKKCPTLLSGRRDAFRRQTSFTGAISSFVRHGEPAAIVPYMSVRDCHRPALLLRIYSWGESWQFMNKVAFMANGNVALEFDIDHSSVGQEIFPGGVEETADLLMTSEQIPAARQIAASNDSLARVTGKKGYKMVKKKFMQDFQKDLNTVLDAYDKVNAAIDALGGLCRQKP